MDHNESSPDFSEALLYRQNNKFIEGDAPEPHNAKEIQANLESRFGPPQTFLSQWRGKILSLILLIINVIFAFAVFYGIIIAFNVERIKTDQAVLIMLIAYGVGWAVISAVKKSLFGNMLAVSDNTPVMRQQAYKSLIEKGEVVNGTIVDVVNLLGNLIITYSVKSPTLKVLQHTYKTDSKTYGKEDVGKEVAVLYLNETVNVLL